MLINLHIKNVALIEKIDVSFDEGLNILSGETGAGKSILIESINFVLGERATKDFIRHGEDSAMVEALFFISDEKTLELLTELDIEIGNERQILLSRTLSSSGKTIARINGKAVTTGILKQLSEKLVDFHGQHEHQSLLNASRHIYLLDIYCNNEINEDLTGYQKLLKEYRDTSKEIAAFSNSDMNVDMQIDFLTHQIIEIETVNPTENEENKLVERKILLNNMQKITQYAEESLELLYGINSEDLSASDRVSKASALLVKLSGIDSKLSATSDSLVTVSSLLDNVIYELRHYFDTIENNPDEIDKIEARLNQIYLLKRKYGGTVFDILLHLENAKKKLDDLKNSGQLIEKLNKRLMEIEKKLNIYANKISEIRKKYAKKISVEIIEVLKDLGMKNVKFEIDFKSKETYSVNGTDNIEFMISPNIGEELKPLSKIASGGEMSRIMLALKSVLADSDDIETFIFDEIDMGVSGRTAQQVAQKLRQISKKHQILCITHLPQIASMADGHYLIEKKTANDKTTSTITQLDEEKSIAELARLIGGAEITKKTIEAAREVREMAKK